jgi:uncharacterized membrane protein YccF (DUF307 family)
MNTLGNILWVLLGGFLLALAWVIVGLLWCITIVGIPVGVQCFKFAQLTLFPFGKDIRYDMGTGSLILNILWILFGGTEIAVTAGVIGIIFCVTIVGIPFGIQYFKLAQLALMPFGAQVAQA